MPLHGMNVLGRAKLAGYCRPAKHMNREKQEEFTARKTYKLRLTGCRKQLAPR